MYFLVDTTPSSVNTQIISPTLASGQGSKVNGIGSKDFAQPFRQRRHADFVFCAAAMTHRNRQQGKKSSCLRAALLYLIYIIWCLLSHKQERPEQ